MIRITISNNMKRKSFPFNANTTVRQALEQTAPETGIDPVRQMVTLDGESITGARLDQTFAQFGYTGEPGHDSAYLCAVVKADNA